MNSKSILQTIGTITSIILGIISVEILKYTNNLGEQSIIGSLAEIIVLIVTFYVMIRTGFSFYRSRKEYEGINYYLTIGLALLHFAGATALFVTGLVIDFGKYGLLVLIGVIIVVAWTKHTKNLRNRTIRTV